jgi:hypothetical protein
LIITIKYVKDAASLTTMFESEKYCWPILNIFFPTQIRMDN